MSYSTSVWLPSLRKLPKWSAIFGNEEMLLRGMEDSRVGYIGVGGEGRVFAGESNAFLSGK